MPRVAEHAFGKTGNNLSTTNPIFDFECQFLQKHISSNPSRSGIKTHFEQSEPREQSEPLAFPETNVYPAHFWGWISWYQGWDTLFVYFSMLFCECLSALQHSWTSLNRNRRSQRSAITTNRTHNFIAAFFTKNKLFFGVRSPFDRDRTFCVLQFHTGRTIGVLAVTIAIIKIAPSNALTPCIVVIQIAEPNQMQ